MAGALKENKGLVNLELWQDFRMGDNTWEVVCDSLKTHPTLEVLNLRSAFMNATTAPAVLNSRIQAVVKMLKMNISIHTIHLDACYYQHEVFRLSVIPYLETNRLRPRVLAIQRTRPIPYRAKLLGRALLSARSDPNRYYVLLSGNAEVAFPSTIAAAVNPPTPAAVATTTATGSLPTAAATATTATSAATTSTASASDAFVPTIPLNVAPPSAAKKR
jgi:hypothetical protein